MKRIYWLDILSVDTRIILNWTFTNTVKIWARVSLAQGSPVIGSCEHGNVLQVSQTLKFLTSKEATDLSVKVLPYVQQPKENSQRRQENGNLLL
jgi:hypothetical protein